MRKNIPYILVVVVAGFALTVAPRWVNAAPLVPATPNPVAAQGEKEATRVVETEPGYRLQLMAVDLGAVMLIPNSIGLGIVSLVFGPSVLHFAHGRTEEGSESMLLRVLLPILTGGLFLELANGCRDESGSDWFSCQDTASAKGFLLGLGTAMVVDYAFLAGPRETERTPARVSSKPGLSGFALVPSNNGGSMMLSGRF